MTNGINTRELILQILLEIEEEGKHSHIAIRNALSKYQFLPKQDRAFITRVCEGTLEYRIQIDYIINSFSKVTVDKMKPAIREILRSAVYQLKYMDSVPDSAVCNEAVKLAQRKGFYNLKPFVNGVLRTIAREMDQVRFPQKEDEISFRKVFHARGTGNQVAGSLWRRNNREDTGGFSYGTSSYHQMPDLSEFQGRDYKKPGKSGRSCSTCTISALCIQHF